MAVGRSGWSPNRTSRDGARVGIHAEVARAEAALLEQQAALRTALTGAAEDLEAVLASMAQAEDALLAARQAWTAATATPVEAAPVRAPKVSVAFQLQAKKARRASAPRPSFTYGSWV
jgi:hypothetical protein